MHKVRAFQLVLCADVWDGVGKYVVRVLEQAVAAEKAKRGFDGLFPEPLVVYSPREGPVRSGSNLGMVPAAPGSHYKKHMK